MWTASEEAPLSFDYKKAGVDVVAGDALVDWLTETAPRNSIHQDRIVSGIGGFASLFRIQFPEMKKPCLITCTDGVGTKVKLASHFQDYSGIGQDLVAMCVNDLICTGGMPLLFLDYYATGKLELEAAKAFLQSVRKACEESLCALVGGETAEMPGVYHEKDFDCAGFAVGVVDEEKVLGAHRVQDGDVLLGVSSAGFHSNGYSLLRKVFADDLDSWREELLRPTALYVKLMQRVRQARIDVHAVAHITGGGVENIPRILPEASLKMELQPWDWPAPFKEVQKRTGMSDQKMLETLNCGVGLVLVLPPEELSRARKAIEDERYRAIDVGRVVRR